MTSDHTFYLLKPLQTIKAAEPKQWIGRIVKSYEDPESNFTPHSALPSSFAPGISDDTGFSNVEAIIKSANSTTFSAMLADMLRLGQADSGSSAPEFKSRKVRRLKLQQEGEYLRHRLALPEVKGHLKDWHSTRHPVYFIVGLLITDHVRYSDSSKKQSSREVEAEPPTKLAAAAMGVPGPTPTVAKIGASSSKGSELDMSLTASGTRIFAVEYRVLRKRFLSTSGHIDMRPGGIRGDRAFAHEEDQTGASDMEQQQIEIVMDEDTLADVDEEAEERCITVPQ